MLPRIDCPLAVSLGFALLLVAGCQPSAKQEAAKQDTAEQETTQSPIGHANQPNESTNTAGGGAGTTRPAKQPADEPPTDEPDSTSAGTAKMSITKSAYGETSNGQAIDLYTLTNANGIVAKLTNYGAILVGLEVPDRDGVAKNIVLAYDDLAGYEADTSYYGATVGRYGNRIAGGKFTLDGEEYTLATNNDANHLHGGAVGFNKRIWNANTIKAGDEAVGVRFSYTSPDGEEGYPGTLNVVVTYLLTKSNELRIDYEAKSTKATPCNLTHHSYFNLAGDDSGDVLDQELQLECDEYLVVDSGLIPTGEIKSVKDTPLDFTTSKKIGQDIAQEPGLYDHCFVIRKSEGPLPLAARVTDPKSGRTMEIFSGEPGIQFYTANHLNGGKGLGGASYGKHQGFCLETQHYPDSPNKPDFPSTVLKPGETYRTTTVHKFSAK